VGALTADIISQFRALVANRIGEARYRTWFGESASFRLHPGGVEIAVPNNFVGNWIASNYMNDLVASAQQALDLDSDVNVRIVLSSDKPANTERAKTLDLVPPPRTPAPRAKLRGELAEFVVGPSNKLAFTAAKHLVRDPGQAFKLLVLYSGCGLGKTHLLQGICNGVAREHPDLEWRYISGEQFTNEFIAAVKSGHVDLFRARYRHVDLLVIDDIHFLANKKATQEEFLHTFNAIDACGKAVVLSTDRHPRGISSLSEPLIDRLIAGMVAEIDLPDFEVRRAILCRRAVSMKCAVPDEVLDFMADRIARNVRELEGALYKLVALASLTKDAVTLDLAQTALNDHIVHTSQTPNADKIVQLAGRRFGVTREQVFSKSRDRTIALARAVTMHLVRKHTLMSYPEIGRVLGGKNHSTVLMAVQRIEKQLGQDSTVTWKTINGKHEALIGDLLDGLEKELFPAR